MQRINLSVDLEENKILSREIEKAIQGVVKNKTRAYFNETLETELERVANKTTDEWINRSRWNSNKNRLEKELERQIDSKIKEEIGKIDVSSADIQKRINEQLENINNIIMRTVEEKMEKIPLEIYISDIVTKEVKRILPVRLLEFLAYNNTVKEERQE